MPPLIRLPAHAALLLDFDGTLIDLAATPDSVVIPPDLAHTLVALREKLGGALAIVTGRTIDTLDVLLGEPFAAAGEHGAALRHAAGALIEHASLPRPPGAWLAEAQARVAAFPGALLERKTAGFVLHFRQCPEAGPALESTARAIVANDARFAVMPSKMAWEIKPATVNKGAAVAALMRVAPFAGRTPVYIGDDVTDEAGIAAAVALGGLGWRVEEEFGTPADVRAWLAAL